MPLIVAAPEKSYYHKVENEFACFKIWLFKSLRTRTGSSFIAAFQFIKSYINIIEVCSATYYETCIVDRVFFTELYSYITNYPLLRTDIKE